MSVTARRQLGPIVRHPWAGSCVFGPLSLLVAVACVAAAAEPQPLASRSPAADSLPAELRSHLEAGEFSVALELARQTRGDHRDRYLADIGAAQRNVGARRAWLATASAIGDDRVRARLLQSDVGAAGGGTQADFDELIELITGTIAPETWDLVGGPGAIDAFAGGVYVDPHGVLRNAVARTASTRLIALRGDGLRPLVRKSAAQSREPRLADTQSGARRASALRRVSLTRLEKQVQLRLASGRRPTETMRVLAGLQRIKYLLIYPETGDLVVAGPAGDWQVDHPSRIVSRETGDPVLLLDDLVVVLRSMSAGGEPVFGCSIDPMPDGLARTRQFLDSSAARPLKPGKRREWLDQLRAQLGRQQINVFGIDPQSHAARVLVEADYHMKLIGMGLAESVAGVPSYLDLVKVPPGEAPPPLSVLRWWFTLNYRAVLTTPDRNAFEIRGPGAKVLSENQLLTAAGRRLRTGGADPLNQEFTHNFTAHFAALSSKYPIYAELRNLFDLALVAAILTSEQLDSRVAWHRAFFGDPQSFVVARGPAARQVESVINHRVVNRKHILAGVSGGVSVDPWSLVERSAIEVTDYGQLRSARGRRPEPASADAWWWD